MMVPPQLIFDLTIQSFGAVNDLIQGHTLQYQERNVMFSYDVVVEFYIEAGRIVKGESWQDRASYIKLLQTSGEMLKDKNLMLHK